MCKKYLSFRCPDTGILTMTKKKIFLASVIALAVLAIYYCSGNPAGDLDVVYSNPSFKDHIQPILTLNCSLYGCHHSTARAGLVLMEGSAYENLVNIPSTQEPGRMRVLPGDSANSYLIIKIEGNQTIGTFMPQGREILDEVYILNIKNWINRGALDN